MSNLPPIPPATALEEAQAFLAVHSSPMYRLLTFIPWDEIPQDIQNKPMLNVLEWYFTECPEVLFAAYPPLESRWPASPTAQVFKMDCHLISREAGVGVKIWEILF